MEERCREIIGWRMQLVPYLTAAFQRYAYDGTPPFRALALDSPEDRTLSAIDDQYMVGDRMLVAPLFAGEPSRSVALPSGVDWHDFWTGAAVAGGTQITVPASVKNIPVYVKTGSVIPWADIAQHAEAPESRRISVRIYGDGSVPFEMTEGQQSLRLSWRAGRGTVSGKGKYHVYQWKQMG